ncbi:hypothetical protein SAMN05444745_12238 [Arthrobacter sp. OV608]|nr:hypothetical protein SAMN05444745_12238 [Arthrobacter sp. OV608]
MGVPPPEETQPKDDTAQSEASAAVDSWNARRVHYERQATAGVVLGGLAILSMFVTAPLAMFAMLGTYPSDGGPSPTPWVTPLVFFSLPLLFALPSLALAISVIRNSPDASPARSSAAFALCISGLVFALALGPALDLLGNI